MEAMSSFLIMRVYIPFLLSLFTFIVERAFDFLDLFSPACVLSSLVAASFRP